MGFLVSGLVLCSVTPVAQMRGALEHLREVFDCLLPLYTTLVLLLRECKEQKEEEKSLHVLMVVKTIFQVVILELNFQRVWVDV